MMGDELQILREFRAEVPEPDQDTARRVYARATRPRRRWWETRGAFTANNVSSRFAVAAALLAATGAASAISVFTLAGRHAPTSKAVRGSQPGIVGFGGMATLSQPLPPFGKQVSMADASSGLGTSVTLPNLALVSPADAGSVWMASLQGPSGERSVSVAVTFPSQGLIIRYSRPPIPDPQSNFENFVQDSPGSQVVSLNGGVPALAIAQLPDGSNWGSIEFVAGGTNIVVMGHDDEATLQSVAQSILAQISS